MPAEDSFGAKALCLQNNLMHVTEATDVTLGYDAPGSPLLRDRRAQTRSRDEGATFCGDEILKECRKFHSRCGRRG